MAFRYAPQGAVISVPADPGLGGIAKFCFSWDGLGVVYSNPNYDGVSLGTNRGQIKFATWDGTDWVSGDTFYGAPPSLSSVTSTDYNNLFAGEILAASSNLSIIAYSQRFTDDSSQKHIFRQVGASTSARFRVDPFSGYVPTDIRLSSTGARLAVLFQNNSTGNHSIRLFKQGSVSTTGVLEGEFQNITGANFSMSEDGNLVFAGTTLKSWDGTAWQTGSTFTGATASAINSAGTRLVVNDGAAAKVYTLSGGTWTQLGAGFSASNSLWMSPDGTRVQVGAQIYSWNGAIWSAFTSLPSGGVLSSSGESAGVLDGTLTKLRAYELLENPFPFYLPSRASAIYAGATEGKAIYYGSTLLWNVSGWTP